MADTTALRPASRADESYFENLRKACSTTVQHRLLRSAEYYGRAAADARELWGDKGSLCVVHASIHQSNQLTAYAEANRAASDAVRTRLEAHRLLGECRRILNTRLSANTSLVGRCFAVEEDFYGRYNIMVLDAAGGGLSSRDRSSYFTSIKGLVGYDACLLAATSSLGLAYPAVFTRGAQPSPVTDEERKEMQAFGLRCVSIMATAKHRTGSTEMYAADYIRKLLARNVLEQSAALSAALIRALGDPSSAALLAAAIAGALNSVGSPRRAAAAGAAPAAAELLRLHAPDAHAAVRLVTFATSLARADASAADQLRAGGCAAGARAARARLAPGDRPASDALIAALADPRGGGGVDPAARFAAASAAATRSARSFARNDFGDAAAAGAAALAHLDAMQQQPQQRQQQQQPQPPAEDEAAAVRAEEQLFWASSALHSSQPAQLPPIVAALRAAAAFAALHGQVGRGHSAAMRHGDILLILGQALASSGSFAEARAVLTAAAAEMGVDHPEGGWQAHGALGQLCLVDGSDASAAAEHYQNGFQAARCDAGRVSMCVCAANAAEQGGDREAAARWHTLLGPIAADPQDCPVCLAAMAPGMATPFGDAPLEVIHCKHVLHAACLAATRGGACPVCRAAVATIPAAAGAGPAG